MPRGRVGRSKRNNKKPTGKKYYEHGKIKSETRHNIDLFISPLLVYEKIHYFWFGRYGYVKHVPFERETFEYKTGVQHNIIKTQSLNFDAHLTKQLFRKREL